MQTLGIKRIMQPLATNENVATSWHKKLQNNPAKNNHTTAWDKKMQPFGTKENHAIILHKENHATSLHTQKLRDLLAKKIM